MNAGPGAARRDLPRAKARLRRAPEQASLGLMMATAVGAIPALAACIFAALVNGVASRCGFTRMIGWPFWISLALSVAAFFCAAHKTRDPRPAVRAGRVLLTSAVLLLAFGCAVNG